MQRPVFRQIAGRRMAEVLALQNGDPLLRVHHVEAGCPAGIGAKHFTPGPEAVERDHRLVQEDYALAAADKVDQRVLASLGKRQLAIGAHYDGVKLCEVVIVDHRKVDCGG